MSAGNIQAKSKVGLLFIDFQTPQRIRVRGDARCIKEGPILKSFPGAKLRHRIDSKQSLGKLSSL